MSNRKPNESSSLELKSRINQINLVAAHSNLLISHFSQALLRAASAAVYTATNQRAFFRDVTIVVPSAWPRSCTGSDPPGQATTESYLTSDLRVSTPHPVYGAAPWTQQWGLCGQPGDFMQLAADYLASEDDGDLGKKG